MNLTNRVFPYTQWRVWNRSKEVFEHNHIEPEHVSGNVPTARTDEQRKQWKGQKWEKVFGYLRNGEFVAWKCDQ